MKGALKITTPSKKNKKLMHFFSIVVKVLEFIRKLKKKIGRYNLISLKRELPFVQDACYYQNSHSVSKKIEYNDFKRYFGNIINKIHKIGILI